MNAQWLALATTREFFAALESEFDFNNGWYHQTDEEIVWRLRGQRDVFNAIQRIIDGDAVAPES